MTARLSVSIGQYSDRGRKDINQDYIGTRQPGELLLEGKGIVLALADGISSSQVSHLASTMAVHSLMDDYYRTSDAWSVRSSAERAITACNASLYKQTQQGDGRYNKDRGYVCTLSSLILKSRTAHLFHIGDSRIYRRQGDQLELLTRDHRVYSGERSYLGRALGVNPHVDIDYRSLPLSLGDTFMLASDGVYEHVEPAFICATLDAWPDDLDHAARLIGEQALADGSSDNLSVQLVRIDSLPGPDSHELSQQAAALPLPPLPEPGETLDGYRILRRLHTSSRSHVYLAEDADTGEQRVLKLPSIDLRSDPDYLERLLLEEWVARRIDNPHVLKPGPQSRPRHFLYTTSQYIEGRTLAQWMLDHPQPELEAVRQIIEQIARGLQAFHRQEMLHQDLRPQNILIDHAGNAHIIDFGSVRVAGLNEMGAAAPHEQILGTLQYSAPEYFLGAPGTPASDLFSLAVIAYQMLSGRLPYGTEVSKCHSRAAQLKLKYTSVLDDEREIPLWLDACLKKALAIDPQHRYQELSEFIYDLRHPNTWLTRGHQPPLLQRNPLLVWKGISAVLSIIIVVMVLNWPG